MAKPVPNPTSRLRDRLDYHKARRETRTVEHLIDMTCRDFDQIFAAAESGLDASAALERAERERDGWIESARQAHEGMAYYRGLVDEIGKQLGPDAYTADDGSVSEDVLRAKVPELIGAALERARAEGVMSAYNAVSAIKHTDEGHARGLEDAEAAIRALGPVPRPSPEAEAPKESATKWLAVNFRKRAQALRVAAEHGESPAAWHAAAETYETAAGVAERWRPTPGAVEATTPPALAPELRERVARVLPAFANIAAEHESETEHDRIKVSVPLGHIRGVVRLLSALSSDQPEPKDDGWIAWGGGHGCPLAYGTRVTIHTREGVEDCDEATVFNWAHAGSPHDIIAYRLSQTDGGAK